MSTRISNAFELIQNDIASKRQSLQNLDKRLFPNETELHPKPSSLIEICGPNGCGKSYFLHYILGLTVLPSDFGGKQGEVILIDLKNKFDADAFLCQLYSIIKQNSSIPNMLTESDLTDNKITQIALDCLKRVTVYYSFSPDDLADNLDDVENMLMEDENGEIILLAIDGLNSFYWIENFERRKRMSTYYAQLVVRLRDICNQNCISSAYTLQSTYLESKGTNAASVTSPSSSDYEFVLNFKLGGLERTLNGLNVSIDKNGFQFL